MPNYQNGKIYALKSHQTENIYIGSTTQKLCQRLGKHRRTYEIYGGECSSKEILKYPDYYIELIENCPCNSKEELLAREGYYIRKYKDKCVNIIVAGRNRKECYEDNKDKILEKNKKYREENKEAIRQQRKEYREEYKEVLNQISKENYEANKEQILERMKKKYTCDCGSTLRKSDKSRHEKSKKHQEYIKNN